MVRIGVRIAPSGAFVVSFIALSTAFSVVANFMTVRPRRWVWTRIITPTAVFRVFKSVDFTPIGFPAIAVCPAGPALIPTLTIHTNRVSIRRSSASVITPATVLCIRRGIGFATRHAFFAVCIR